jgi:hypothetical protein
LDSFRGVAIDEKAMIHPEKYVKTHHYLLKLISRKKRSFRTFLRAIFTWNYWCKGVPGSKIMSHDHHKLRSSLNSAEVNNFVNAGDNGADHEPRITVNTQNHTPNMEKRNIVRDDGSVSSEEDKENAGSINV